MFINLIVVHKHSFTQSIVFNNWQDRHMSVNVVPHIRTLVNRSKQQDIVMQTVLTSRLSWNHAKLM